MNANSPSEPENPIAAAIAAAEDIRDPLEGLVERTATDLGAPFVPDVLGRLAALRREDRAVFEGLRAQLKDAGCRVTELDRAIADENGEKAARRPTQADILIDLAQSAELFHAPDGTGFVDLDMNGHRETWPIRAPKGFRRWLARRFFEATQGAPSSEALQSALNVIEAKAHFDAPERTVHTRVGGLDGRLYLDLCDATWRAVEIDTNGWRLIDNPPVRFRRAAGMQSLPVPVAGGSIEVLRSFLNVQSDNDFVLVVAWALAVLRNRGPYPVLALSGEQGSAKSTFSAILRALLDPNTAPLRALPREDRDLFIAASNGHVLAFDNVSHLPATLHGFSRQIETPLMQIASVRSHFPERILLGQYREAEAAVVGRPTQIGDISRHTCQQTRSCSIRIREEELLGPAISQNAAIMRPRQIVGDQAS